MKRLVILLIPFMVLCNASAQQNDNTAYNEAMSRRDYQSAIHIMANILKDKNLRNFENYYKRAFAYYNLGNLIYAIADCTSALSCDPYNSKAYYLRGKSKLEFGDPTYIKDLRQGGSEGLALLTKRTEATNESIYNSNNIYANIISDVDIDIPVSTSGVNSKTFVLILSNENYSESNVSRVYFANKDGETFKQYCIKTLSIPEDNIHMKIDATRNQMRSEIKWLQNVSEAFGKNANIIVYYSGHGMPDETSQKAYLLPSDGIANDPESAYSLSSLYKQLGSMDVNSVVVFLDACFSGSQRNGEMLTASKGVAIKPKDEVLDGRVIVMSASQGDETAYTYNEKGHGLFTYFLLKKLQESKGNISLYDLSQFIVSNVRQVSIIKNKRNQTPVVSASANLHDIWGNLKLK